MPAPRKRFSITPTNSPLDSKPMNPATFTTPPSCDLSERPSWLASTQNARWVTPSSTPGTTGTPGPRSEPWSGPRAKQPASATGNPSTPDSQANDHDFVTPHPGRTVTRVRWTLPGSRVTVIGWFGDGFATVGYREDSGVWQFPRRSFGATPWCDSGSLWCWTMCRRLSRINVRRCGRAIGRRWSGTNWVLSASDWL